MALVASEVLARLEALKAKHATAQQAEAVARSQFEQAQQVAAKANQALRDLGVDPEQAEQQLTAELVELDRKIAECDKAIDEALVGYRAISEQFAKLNQA